GMNVCRLPLAYRSVILLIILALFAGCGHDYADPATLAATLEPETVFAELSGTPTLPKAATQFAAALNIDPTLVRIRIKPGNCSVCSLAARPEMASLAGVSVAEAEKLVEIDDEVSFVIPNFSCTFLYDGEQLTPRSCQHTPI
ncbi:MAG: hypothetical protein R3E79_60075, partial [Caldilineaceae bacterium]